MQNDCVITLVYIVYKQEQVLVCNDLCITVKGTLFIGKYVGHSTAVFLSRFTVN